MFRGTVGLRMLMQPGRKRTDKGGVFGGGGTLLRCALYPTEQREVSSRVRGRPPVGAGAPRLGDGRVAEE